MEGFQPPPFGLAILVAVLLLAGNVIVILMTQLCENGTITRGGLAGIRTAATRASDEAWQAGHRAALPVARIGNGFAAVLAAGTLLASGTVVPYLVILGIAVAVSLISVAVGALVANRAAGRLT